MLFMLTLLLLIVGREVLRRRSKGIIPGDPENATLPELGGKKRDVEPFEKAFADD